MTLVPDFNDPESGNPDFQPGEIMASSQVDGNFDHLRDWLNNGNISDVNVQPGGLSASTVIADGSIDDIKISDADITGVDLTIGISGAKLQNNSVDDRVLGVDAVRDIHVSAPGAGPYVPTSPGISGSKIQDGSIPLAKLDTPIPAGPGNVPIGSVQWFAGASAPADWIICDGQELDKVAYVLLFNFIGSVWDADPALPAMVDPVNNFRVPDLRSRSAVGIGTQNNLADADAIAEAARNGPEHTHGESLTIADSGTHQHGDGTLTGSKTGQSSGTAFDDASRYETGHIITPTGYTGINQIDADAGGGNWGAASVAPAGGGAGVSFTKLNHFHSFNITGIVITGSVAADGDHAHGGVLGGTIDNAELPYLALLPIIYAGV